MSLYFITGNKNKFQEAQKIIPNIKQLNIDLPEIQEINPRKIIEAKLKEALKNYKGEFIVEDTSLYFDCLNNLPGPLIKWFLKSIGNQGLFEITEKFQNNKARAETMIGYCNNEEEIHYFSGILEGEICFPQKKSFGWDPIFKPKKLNKSFAEMNLEEKNKISMRAQAFLKLKNFLNKKGS